MTSDKELPDYIALTFADFTIARLREELSAAKAKARREGWNAATEKMTAICAEKVEYAMPISCPDGIEGCCVAHSITAKRERTAKEIQSAIRALQDTGREG